MTASIVITAYGKPAPQGSKRSLGKGIMVESNPRTRPWRETVKQAALDVMATGDYDRIHGPVHLYAAFAFDRPKAHYNAKGVVRPSAPLRPESRANGDLSKLVRAAEDSLVDAGVIADDSLIVGCQSEKVWTGDVDGLDIPGALLIVTEYAA